MHSSLKNNFNAYVHTTGEFSTWIAFISFAIGTVLFGAHQLGLGSDNLIVFGFVYVIIAALFNLLVLLNLILLFAKEHDYRRYFAIKILILLANIPVVFFYLTFI
ncbi:MAG: hypothetical protein EOO50_17355 [Flavobacterium sp.]|uniref:hypothetical protein n=1 Tax=Flavobacterium sp. TaxID=239 RepID=UPI0012176474|nr:hypothetical protein [Flavobacterium sp.]RZJ63224.1 MAG: hypothetical protein EOO50_17355 [Flavobacterium sp.]